MVLEPLGSSLRMRRTGHATVVMVLPLLSLSLLSLAGAWTCVALSRAARNPHLRNRRVCAWALPASIIKRRLKYSTFKPGCAWLLHYHRVYYSDPCQPLFLVFCELSR